ncbi:hypothetical protein SAMN05216349_12734 [Oribacterium sp. KHPX15]|uniref:hypothetical protein n=1 Tax=Oribacterium sp. KHPX15 TaxID=1855342 RepID=UPI00089752E1|nr:hypothetical protein [Oribacterium sp. KHPX15]SEA76597.1 hypothetical protein SAMN05216349_12734 [Oribacterium sp. KHPX15]
MQVECVKENYCNYLREVRKLKESSIKHYLDAIIYISNNLSQYKIINETLFEVCDLRRLDDIKTILDSDQDFISLNKRGHQMYSAGFNNYYRFCTWFCK